MTDHYWSDKLSKKLNKKVKVKLNSKGVGKATIEIDSIDDLESIVDQIMGS